MILKNLMNAKLIVIILIGFSAFSFSESLPVALKYTPVFYAEMLMNQRKMCSARFPETEKFWYIKMQEINEKLRELSELSRMIGNELAKNIKPFDANNYIEFLSFGQYMSFQDAQYLSAINDVKAKKLCQQWFDEIIPLKGDNESFDSYIEEGNRLLGNIQKQP